MCSTRTANNNNEAKKCDRALVLFAEHFSDLCFYSCILCMQALRLWYNLVV